MLKMAEYIERETLMKRFCKRCNKEMSESPCEPSDCFAREVIKTIPAADVAPVVHGKWLRSDDDWYNCTVIQCSICGEEWCFETIDDVTLLNYKYCPNCGAKMDGHTEWRT